MPPPTITSYSRPTRKLWRTRNHPHQGSGWLCTEHLSVYTANQDLRGLEIRTSKYKCADAELDTQAIVLVSGRRFNQDTELFSQHCLLIRSHYQMLTRSCFSHLKIHHCRSSGVAIATRILFEISYRTTHHFSPHLKHIVLSNDCKPRRGFCWRYHNSNSQVK